ncbi:MAG TPA: hypothetical protein VF122_04715 [Caulobacteraceae bacterium]
MPRVSLAFFIVAALCGLVGMLWGMQMGISGDHALHPIHAHLNLLGWVTLAIMGGFYVLAGDRAPIKLAWANFALSSSGVVIMTPLLTQVMTGREDLGPFMLIPELMVVGGMLCFIAAIVTVARRSTVAA